MSTRWVRVALCAAIVLVLVPTLEGTARADGPTTYSSFAVHEGVNGVADSRSSSITGDIYAGFTGDGLFEQVEVSVDEYQPDAWAMQFSAPQGESLQVGHTYSPARSDTYGGAHPGLSVTRNEDHCGGQVDLLHTSGGPDTQTPVSIGRFTVRQLERDDGRLTAFAATFEQNCQQIGAPSVQGSVAWQAPAPADAVPAPSSVPGQITGVHVVNTPNYKGNYSSNTMTITWKNPTDASWVDSYVGTQARRPGGPLSTHGWDASYRGTEPRSSTVVDGMDSLDFDLFGINDVGRYGPDSRLALRGVRIPLDAYQSTVTMGQSTAVRGQALESANTEGALYGAPIVGGNIGIYSHPVAARWDDWQLQGHAATGADGRFVFAITPEQNTVYDIRYPGDSRRFGNDSYSFVTLVAPAVDLSVARHRVRRHATVRFTTARTTAGSRGVVALQRFDGHAWRTIVTKRISQAAGARSRRVPIMFRAKAAGSQAFRLVKPGDAHHTTGVSGVVHVTVN